MINQPTFLYILLATAFFMVVERKALVLIQRRKGSNVTRFWGTLQAIADGLKLIFKEAVVNNLLISFKMIRDIHLHNVIENYLCVSTVKNK